MDEIKGFVKNPLNDQVMNELKKLDGRQVAVKYTLDGEVAIIREGGKDVPRPLEFPELIEPALRPGDRDAMRTFAAGLTAVRERKKRLVPVTRNELIQWGVDKRALRRLQSFGLLRERITGLRQQSTGKAVRGVAVVYPTEQGRAYIQKHIDPQYEQEVREYEQRFEPRADAGRGDGQG